MDLLSSVLIVVDGSILFVALIILEYALMEVFKK